MSKKMTRLHGSLEERRHGRWNCWRGCWSASEKMTGLHGSLEERRGTAGVGEKMIGLHGSLEERQHGRWNCRRGRWLASEKMTGLHGSLEWQRPGREAKLSARKLGTTDGKLGTEDDRARRRENAGVGELLLVGSERLQSSEKKKQTADGNVGTKACSCRGRRSGWLMGSLEQKLRMTDGKLGTEAWNGGTANGKLGTAVGGESVCWSAGSVSAGRRRAFAVIEEEEADG